MQAIDRYLQSFTHLNRSFGLLQTLAGRVIITPSDTELWPSQKSFTWHRQRFELQS